MDVLKCKEEEIRLLRSQCSKLQMRLKTLENECREIKLTMRCTVYPPCENCTSVMAKAMKWSCRMCTLENHFEDAKCVVCGESRPKMPTSAAAADIANLIQCDC